MIPKIIHYSWFTKEDKHKLPLRARLNLLSWKRFFPDWEIKLWNFSNFNTNISKITKLAEYDNKFDVLRDYVKIWALNTYGGIYIDTSLQVTESFDDLLTEKLFLGLGEKKLSWDIIGSERKNLVISELLKELDSLNNIESNNLINQLNELVLGKYEISLESEEVQRLDRLTVFPNNVFNSGTYSKGSKSINYHEMNSKKPQVSIVMPVWNGDKYLKECIDSILIQSFSNFELIIVDDGSTDNTVDIINSYQDDRIKLIKKKHSGISDSLNLGIENAKGKYIARIDADDMMYPDRLNTQVLYMENNPQIDILGTGFEWGNDKPVKEYYQPRTGQVTLREFLEIGNKIGHPTVMMKKESLLKLPGGIYESYYNGAEDLKLWITALQENLVIHNLKTPTTYYRQHENQVTAKSRGGINIAQRVVNAYTRKNNNDTELTVIIPFKNEGVEIEKTVASTRATSKCNIILVNDCSNDGFDYKKISDRFGCEYIESTYPLGVAGGRNLGVEKANTPYVVLLDGHMRFYDNDWDVRILKHLKEHPESIITSNSSIFKKEGNNPYENEDGKDVNKVHGSKAAVVNLREPGWEFSGKWTSKTGILDLPDELTQCSCVMGAFYAVSKDWWNHIGGLQGLVGWGYDEPLMCIKTYLAGGKCFLLRDFFVGHLYRGKSPYITYNAGIDSNQIYLINLFSPNNEIKEKYENNLKKRIGDSRFKQAKQAFLNRYDDFEKFKEYFYTNVVKLTWEEFLEINNKFY